MNQEFHDHLDVCEQCRNHPMHLCEVGVATLHSTFLSLTTERTTNEISAIDPVAGAQHDGLRAPHSSPEEFSLLARSEAQKEQQTRDFRIMAFARSAIHTMHHWQFDKAENIDELDLGHTQPFTECEHVDCVLAREMLRLYASCGPAGTNADVRPRCPWPDSSLTTHDAHCAGKRGD